MATIAAMAPDAARAAALIDHRFGKKRDRSQRDLC
jgi:hypothetical protein